MILRNAVERVNPRLFIVIGNVSILLFLVLSRWLFRGGNDFVHGLETGALFGVAIVCFYYFAREKNRRRAGGD